MPAPIRCWRRSRKASLCRGARSRRSPRATQPRRAVYSSGADSLHALPDGSVLGVPTGSGRFVRTLFSWRREGADGGRGVRATEARRDGDESIGGFLGRRFGREAVTTSRSRCSRAFMPATSIGSRFVRSFPGCAAEAEHGSVIRALRRQQRGRSPHEAPSSPSPAAWARWFAR